MAQKKKGSAKKKPSTKPVRVQYDDEYEEDDEKDFATTVKGVIAVMITFMVVAIVLMFTARRMFVLQGNEYKEEIPTGIVTSTQPTVYEGKQTAPAEEEDDTGKKKRTASPNAKDDDGNTTTSKLSGTTQYRCVSAVYLHPQPSAESENTLVIPQGAVVDVQKEEGGWLYLDYNGTVGWAYGTFFTINE